MARYDGLETRENRPLFLYTNSLSSEKKNAILRNIV